MAAHPLGPDDDFDAKTAALLRFHAARLMKCGAFRRGERQDARQELSARLMERMRRHDPGRGSTWTFGNCVLTRTSADLSRHASAQKRDRGRERPLRGVSERELEELRERAWRVERVDLRLDVREALADLPPDVRHVAGLLMVFTPAEVGQRTGLSRQRVRRMQKTIEWHLRGRGLP